MQECAKIKGSMKIVGVSVLTNQDDKDLWMMGYDQKLKVEQLVKLKTKMALDAGLDGVVSSANEAIMLRKNFHQDFLIITPGIRLNKISNDDQKRTADVNQAINSGSSYLVVGRPITQSQDPNSSAKKFNQLINEAIANSSTNKY
jgi:orotidine-5'-phosphate decarboxylase